MRPVLVLSVLSLMVLRCSAAPDAPCAADVGPDAADGVDAADGPDAGLDDTASPVGDTADGAPLVAACIDVKPASVAFGTVPMGTEATRTVSIRSCGATDLTVTAIALDPDVTTSSFTLDLGSVPGLEAGPPSPESPLVIDHHEPVYVTVRYAPGAPSKAGQGGALVAEEGRLVIESDGGPPIVVALSAEAVAPASVVAVADVQEGLLVAPQTMLHLRSDLSTAEAGAIAKVRWSVKQPAGSQSVFVPTNEFPNPTFEANVAGTYTFLLTVWDALGQSSEAAVLQVVAVPDEAIHIELLWDTPNDPDQTDEGPETGADMDLHVTHPYASGPDLDADGAPDGWFDTPFDCFWFNSGPNWGSIEPAVDDDPGLDRDDTDGAGPENLNAKTLEDGSTYRIGVHYWHHHGYGPSWATVRVYVYGELVWEAKGVKLVNHDMWEAATIEWPSGVVTPVEAEGGGRKIMHSYENPRFWLP